MIPTLQRILDLKQQILDLESQLPAHSLSPSMLQALEELEDELKREIAQLNLEKGENA